MAKLAWDQTGEKVYETGVDHGVLYIPNASGVYDTGFAWNGLTTVTESPSGAESNPQYADNIKYINLQSAEEFGATVEAFTYPPQFAKCDGSATFYNGVTVGQQPRSAFGLSYRTLKGNDVAGNSYGYKIHLIYGALAAPSEKAFGTINDSPEAVAFSWELTTSPVNVGNIAGTDYKPTAIIVIDSTKVTPANLAALELILYGDVAVEPRLPAPSEVIALFAGTNTAVNMNLAANTPTFVSGTGVITLPAVTGIQWKIDGVNKAPGAQPAINTGTTATVTANPTAGYVLAPGSDDDWAFTRP